METISRFLAVLYQFWMKRCSTGAGGFLDGSGESRDESANIPTGRPRSTKFSLCRMLWFCFMGIFQMSVSTDLQCLPKFLTFVAVLSCDGWT